jgi:hypothetical protein
MQDKLIKNKLIKIEEEVVAGKEEGQALAHEWAMAKSKAHEWALRVIDNIPMAEARGVGRASELGDMSHSILIPALIVLAASGYHEAARILKILGIRSGIVEFRKVGEVAVFTTQKTQRIYFRFSAPADCRGAVFSWASAGAEARTEAPTEARTEARTKAPASAPTEAPTEARTEARTKAEASEASVGARARIKRAP